MRTDVGILSAISTIEQHEVDKIEMWIVAQNRESIEAAFKSKELADGYAAGVNDSIREDFGIGDDSNDEEFMEQMSVIVDKIVVDKDYRLGESIECGEDNNMYLNTVDILVRYLDMVSINDIVDFL